MESSFVSLGSSFTGVRRLPLHRTVHCEHVMCPCVIGISHLFYHLLCLLLTGYTNLKVFWNSDLSSLSDGFVNGPILWVSRLTVKTRVVMTSLSCRSDVYGWLRTARNWGPAIVLPDKKYTNNVRLQYPYKTAGKITVDYILIFKFLDSEGNKKESEWISSWHCLISICY